MACNQPATKSAWECLRRAPASYQSINQQEQHRANNRGDETCGPSRFIPPDYSPEKPATKAPAIPSKIVMKQPPGSRPGMRSFAIAPTTSPMMSVPRIPVMAFRVCENKSLAKAHLVLRRLGMDDRAEPPILLCTRARRTVVRHSRSCAAIRFRFQPVRLRSNTPVERLKSVHGCAL